MEVVKVESPLIQEIILKDNYKKLLDIMQLN